MSRIIYQTDNWGHAGEDHIEFTWRGVTMMLTITDDDIQLIGAKSLAILQRGDNSLRVTEYEYDKKEQPSTTITPYPIDGPGWYRTASNQRIYIKGCDSAGLTWDGEVEDWEEQFTWRKDGTPTHGYTPWTIVAKED